MSGSTLTDEQHRLVEDTAAAVDRIARNCARFALLLAYRQHPDGAPSDFWDSAASGLKEGVRTQMEARGLRYGTTVRVFQVRAMDAFADELDHCAKAWANSVPAQAVAVLDCIPAPGDADPMEGVFTVGVTSGHDVPGTAWTGGRLADALSEIAAWEAAGLAIRSNIGSHVQ